MTTRHSLFTRSLSLLLALIMVFSNMSGLTLRAEAADMDLGDILDKQLSVANKPLHTALVNAEVAMPVLAGMLGEAVEYPDDDPTEEDLAGAFVNGYLSLEPINGWVPTFYNEDGFNDIPYEGAVQLDAELESVSVTFEKDLGVTAQAEAVYAYMKAAGQEAAAQTQLLDRISNATALTALGYLDVYFIEDMIDTVDALEEVEGFTAEELADVKAEYKDIIAQLLDRLVEPGNPYASFQAGKYEDCLVVYAMLAQYEAQGLPHYYQQRDYINAELRDLSKVLYEILGEDNEYVPVIEAILDLMNEDRVTPGNLEDMAGRMDKAAKELPGYNMVESYDVEALDALNALFFAEDAANMPIVQLSYTAVPKMVETTYCDVYNEIVEETEPTTAPTEPVQGTEENPIMMGWQQVYDPMMNSGLLGAYTIPAGETVYFQDYRLGGLYLVASITDADGKFLNFGMTINGEEHPVMNDDGARGDVVASGNPMMPYTIAITNDNDVDGQLWFMFHYPFGSQMNPQLLNMGVNEAVIEAGSQGYHFVWFAKEAGYLVIEMPEGGWTYVVNNVTAGLYGDTQWSDESPAVSAIAVSEGDEIQIMVNGYDPADPWNAPAGTITFNASVEAEDPTVPSEPELGSEENPIFIELTWEENGIMAATRTGYDVPAGKTVYLQAYGLGGLNVVAMLSAGPKMLDGAVTMNGVEMPAVAAGTFNAVASGNPRMPTVFAVTNNSETDGKIFFNVNYIYGSQMNPAQLAMGENKAVIEADSQGYYYTWTAAEDGTLVVEMPAGNWMYVINNMTTYQYGDTQWSDSDPVVNPAEVEVAAGDVIEIMVNGYDPANPWSAPAGTITFVAGMKEEPEAPEHKLVHVEAVEPGCHYIGNIEHWYCTECETVWADEALTQVTNHKSVILPATGSDRLVHMDAVEPACHYNGNVEYWVCYDCEQVWTDEALTQLSNIKNVIVPATGSNMVVHMEAVEPGCHFEGHVEYWFCGECAQVWTDEALTQLSNSKNVIVPAVGAEVEHVAAKAATCFEEGNIEYWFCESCEKVWQDEALTQLTNIKNVVLPIVHAVEHVEAVEPGCENEGNIEYWYCTECGAAWTDELLREVTNLKNVKLPITHTIEHVAANGAACFEEGNVEYWYCTECGTAWTDESLSVTSLTNLKNVIVPASCKTIKHVRAVAPTCTSEGNIKYWYCPDCERVWQDEALTQLTNMKNVVLPASCQNIVHVAAKEATCFEEGNIEHWYCADCLTFWQDEDMLQITNSKNVITPAAHAELTHVEAVAATCEEDGNIEYWFCADCGFAWLDAEGIRNTNLKSVVVPAAHGEPIYHAATRAYCSPIKGLVDGTKEHWECPDCHKLFADEFCTEEMSAVDVVVFGTHMPKGAINFIKVLLGRSSGSEIICAEFDCAYCDAEKVQQPAVVEDVVVNPATCTEEGLQKLVPTVVLNGEVFTAEDTEKKTLTLVNDEGEEFEVEAEVDASAAELVEEEAIPAKEHEFEHVAAVEAKCHEEGNLEYWHCLDPECDEYFIDEAKATPVTKEATVVPAKNPETIHVEGDTCVLEHWYCTECNKTWLDEELTVLADESVALVNHDLEYVAESCYNVEYWHCVECGGYWIDNMSMPTNSKRVVKYPQEHTLVHVAAVAKTCFEEGNIEYWYCEECEAVWQNAELDQLTNFKNVVTPASHADLVHVEAKAATCFENGNIEYWTCPDCDYAWLDAEGIKSTNLKAVVLPMAHGELVHVEAKEPNCYETGNIEYWTCADCGYAWLDAEGVMSTNLKAVVLPATHTRLVHMEAVEPGCHYVGNIEYWVCYDCEGIWADELLHQVTNIKNVIVPELGSEKLEHHEAKEPGIYENGNVEYWFCPECEQVWTDEARTQLSNIKNVQIPSVSSFGGEVNVEFEFNEEYTVGTATVELGRGIWTLNMYGINEMILTVNGEEIEYTPGMGRWTPATAEIINAGYEDKTYVLEVTYPVGHMMNPEVLVMDGATATATATVEAGTQGYFFVIENATKGTYFVTMESENWVNSVANKTSYVYNDMQWSDSDPVVNPVYVVTSTGDTVEIMVNTYDPENPWNAPAGEVKFSVQFKNPVTVNFKALLVNQTTNSNLASAKFPIGYKLTQEDLETLIAENQIDKWFANYKDADKYFFNEEAFFQNVGYTVAEKNNNPYVKLSYAAYVGEDNVKVELDDNKQTNLKNLGYTTVGLYNVAVNGTIYNNITIEDKFDMLWAESNTVEILDKVTALEVLASELEKMGAGEYEVITAEDGTQSLVANMSATQLVTFAQGIFDTKFNGKDNAYLPALLGENYFIYSDGGLQIEMNALVQAILGDEQFTNESLATLANNGKGALVHTTLNTALFSAPLTINLTSVPAQMKDMASVLEKAKSHFQFQGSMTESGSVLDIDVIVPEKVYEAVTGMALVTGNMDKTSVEAIAHLAALTFVEETLAMLMQEEITTQTYTNTLQMLGVNKDLNSYADVYELLKDIVGNAESQFVPGEKTSEVDVSISKIDINNVLPLVGIGDTDGNGSVDLNDIENGANKWVADEFITINTDVTIVNDAPVFDAIVIEKEKSLSAFNMTTDLAAQLASVNNAAAIMLTGDVNGDLVFNHTTILDLNGKTVNGSIIANAPVIITDSSIETVSGAKVTGSVSGNATILAGTYSSDVSAFLRDGFYQENGAVKHALFTIEGGKLLVDPSIYVNNVDGYLPAAHYMAVEIAIDIALNYYTAAGLYVNGKYCETNMLYDLSVEDLVGLIGNKDAGQIADAALSMINAPEFSDFVNKILADLINVDAFAASLKTGETITTYNFQIRPWSAEIEHIMPEDYLTVNINSNEANAKTISLGLAAKLNTEKEITIPKLDMTVSIQEILDEMAKIVVSENDDPTEATFIEVFLNQPVRDGKTLVVGGSADALIHLDFSHNENYNRLLGAALAYFYEDLTMDLVKNGCIVELNQALASITVGEFFGTLNKVVQNKNITFENIAEKLGLTLSENELAKMNKAYAMFQNAVEKVINKFELDESNATPLSDLMDNDGRIVYSGNIQYHAADAYYKGYGVKVELDHINAGVIIELAKGEHTIEHVAAKAPTCIEEGNIEYWYCTVCGYAWLDADLTLNTNLKAVILPLADHVPGEPVIEEYNDGYPCQKYEVVYCSVCGEELSREIVGGLLGDANCDGEVDNIDAMLIARYDVGLTTADQIHVNVCDVNGDGDVDNIDSMLVARYDVGYTSKYPIGQEITG